MILWFTNLTCFSILEKTARSCLCGDHGHDCVCHQMQFASGKKVLLNGIACEWSCFLIATFMNSGVVEGRKYAKLGIEEIISIPSTIAK